MIEKRVFGFGFAVALVAALVLAGLLQLLGKTFTAPPPPEANRAAVQERIKPVGQLNTGEPVEVPSDQATAPATQPAPTSPTTPTPPSSALPATGAQKSAARSGEQVFKSSCQVCHATGAAGAPKLGDKAAWAPRIQQGMPTLVQHAIKGFQGKTGVMPPRGTCANCSDEELKSAVEYMVSKSK